MSARQRPERVSLRRDGRTLHTTLVCICGKSRRFTALVNENDFSPDALFTPVDKINKDIKESGWLDDPGVPNDWCPRCRRYRAASLKWRGYRRYGGPKTD